MKLNPDKCHILINGYKVILTKVGNVNVTESHKVTLLGIEIDSDLKFHNHISMICSKAAKKLNALSRQSHILPFQKRKSLMKAFIMSQFSYCPLVWMFCSRTLNIKINNIHYRALQIVYRDYNSTFKELLVKDDSRSIHHKTLHILDTEIFKVTQGSAPSFMSDIFIINDNISRGNVSSNTRQASMFYNPFNLKTTHFGLETLRSIGPKIWDILPGIVKNSGSLQIIKSRIKTWIPVNCPCQLFRNYVPCLGYV